MSIFRLAAVLAGLAVADAAAAEEHTVVQKERSFGTAEVRVRAGDRVVFSNQDNVTHNLFSRSPGFEFEVKVQLPGQETPVDFDRPGEAEVRCAIHPQMKLRVVVEPKE
jgi:plastocyanin